MCLQLQYYNQFIVPIVNYEIYKEDIKHYYCRINITSQRRYLVLNKFFIFIIIIFKEYWIVEEKKKIKIKRFI